jgi:hypothetical protein
MTDWMTVLIAGMNIHYNFMTNSSTKRQILVSFVPQLVLLCTEILA